LPWSSAQRNDSFSRTGSDTRYRYDPNSNRLTAVDKVSSDIDLDALFNGDNSTQTTTQTLNVDSASNKLLGFSQSLTLVKGSKSSSTASQVNYAVHANGALTSDGLRTFEYDASRRLSKVRILKDGEAASVHYLHNALGQRVFKSDPQSDQTLPSEAKLGPGFVNWLRKQFGWLFTGNGNSASIGLAFAYDEDGNLLGEYDNGSAAGRGRTEYIWLPTDSGQAMPVGIYRNGKFYSVHGDHLGTPRLITDASNTPVWQSPYSAFGNNKPTGVVEARTGSTGQTTLKGTNTPVQVNLRFPGQYFDEESNLSYNYFRSYQAGQGRYTQADPIGIGGELNRFSYVKGNPLMFTDPPGLRSTGSPTLDRWLEPVAPPGNCATGECAAGMPPTPSDNRSQKEMDFGQCKLVCQISLLVPVAMCNAAAGGGLTGTAAAAVAKGGLCTWVCK
jgi:RHS repeat-associated protein